MEWIGRQMNGQLVRKIDGKLDSQLDKQIERQKERQKDRKKDRVFFLNPRERVITIILQLMDNYPLYYKKEKKKVAKSVASH